MTTLPLHKYLPYIFLIGGLIGFLASFILTLDTMHILKDPSYSPPCNINPIISCGSVMKTDQSSVLGFTNSLLGVAGFAALMALGTALLAGAKFQIWLWRLLLAAATVGAFFVHWLIFQSLYRIGSLCPYCMAVWSVTIPIFWYTLLYNLQLSKYSRNKYVQFLLQHHGNILTAWLLLIVILIANRFWYYWSTLL